MDRVADKLSLKAVLEQELKCTELLLQTLAAERTALAKRDMATLEITTNEKITYYQSLEALNTQREQAVSGLGFATDQTGTSLCFESLPETEKLADLWLQIMSNIEACKTSNLINGGLLESGRQHVEQVLGILRGQAGAPAMYTQSGTASANLGHRKLGEV